jgi:hypothetical protein
VPLWFTVSLAVAAAVLVIGAAAYCIDRLNRD